MGPHLPVWSVYCTGARGRFGPYKILPIFHCNKGGRGNIYILLVAVLHAASVIGCWRRAAGAARLRTAPDNARCTPPTHLYQHTITLAAPAARPQHPMTLAACNTSTRHVPPALALAP